MRATLFAILFLASCTFVIAQTHLYSDTTYHISNKKSEVVTIQNSLPKGGGYTDPAGKTVGYVIFWTHVTNETTAPLELTINFPTDSFTTYLKPGFVFKIFLPPGTMTLDKEPLYDFGAAGLRSFLDAGLKKPSRLQKTIDPKGDYYFYIGILIYSLPPGNGALRTGLVLKGDELFYRISMEGIPESTMVPCGKIFLRK